MRMATFSAKVFIISLCLFVSALSPKSHCFLKGDIDGNDKIELKEGINALQVVAGLRSTIAQKTIKVPGDFSTIQEAIDVAAEGDTIEIAAGTYNEVLIIEKDRITLQGDGQDSTVISGNDTDDTIYLNNVRNVVISDLKITNGEQGIHSVYSSFLCKNSKVQSNKRRGLNVSYNSYATIQSVLVQNNNDDGLRIRRGSTAFIENSEFDSNGGPGLGVRGDANAYVNNSTFSKNGVGIASFTGSFVEIYQSAITSNTGGGVRLSANSGVRFLGTNEISNNSQFGINAFNNTTIRLEGNPDTEEYTSIHSNEGTGINMYSVYALFMNAGRIYNNQGDGIALHDMTSVAIDKASITNNSGYGINCYGGPQWFNPEIDFGSSSPSDPSYGLNDLGDTNNCNN